MSSFRKENEQLSLDFSIAVECTDVVHSLIVHPSDEESNRALTVLRDSPDWEKKKENQLTSFN